LDDRPPQNATLPATPAPRARLWGSTSPPSGVRGPDPGVRLPRGGGQPRRPRRSPSKSRLEPGGCYHRSTPPNKSRVCPRAPALWGKCVADPDPHVRPRTPSKGASPPIRAPSLGCRRPREEAGGSTRPPSGFTWPSGRGMPPPAGLTPQRRTWPATRPHVGKSRGRPDPQSGWIC
jgi:hypothetical protein